MVARGSKEATLSPLTVFCPRSGYPVNSGIEIDRETYERLRGLTLRVACPECGERHDMRVGEGHLARAEPATFDLSECEPLLKELAARMNTPARPSV